MATDRLEGRKSDYAYVHFGINTMTLEVNHVWETRGGVLEGGGLCRQPSGRETKIDLAETYHLTDIRSSSVNALGEQADAIRAELQKIADEQKHHRHLRCPPLL